MFNRVDICLCIQVYVDDIGKWKVPCCHAGLEIELKGDLRNLTVFAPAQAARRVSTWSGFHMFPRITPRLRSRAKGRVSHDKARPSLCASKRWRLALWSVFQPQQRLASHTWLRCRVKQCSQNVLDAAPWEHSVVSSEGKRAVAGVQQYQLYFFGPCNFSRKLNNIWQNMPDADDF